MFNPVKIILWLFALITLTSPKPTIGKGCFGILSGIINNDHKSYSPKKNLKKINEYVQVQESVDQDSLTMKAIQDEIKYSRVGNFSLKEVSRPEELSTKRSLGDSPFFHPDFWDTIEELERKGYEVFILIQEDEIYHGMSLGFSKKILLSPNATWLTFIHEINHIEFHEKVTESLIRFYGDKLKNHNFVSIDDEHSLAYKYYSSALSSFVSDLENNSALGDFYLTRLIKRYREGVTTFNLINEVMTSDLTLKYAKKEGHGLFNAEFRNERIYQLSNLDAAEFYGMFDGRFTIIWKNRHDIKRKILFGIDKALMRMSKTSRRSVIKKLKEGSFAVISSLTVWYVVNTQTMEIVFSELIK